MSLATVVRMEWKLCSMKKIVARVSEQIQTILCELEGGWVISSLFFFRYSNTGSFSLIQAPTAPNSTTKANLISK
jgi:hypothetical protein